MIYSLFSYSPWVLWCAVMSTFGFAGFYPDLLRPYINDIVTVVLFVLPLAIIIFVQWGEFPNNIVSKCHIFAVTLITIYSVGMEIASLFNYKPEGVLFYKILSHIGWSFAWVGILKKAKNQE